MLRSSAWLWKRLTRSSPTARRRAGVAAGAVRPPAAAGVATGRQGGKACLPQRGSGDGCPACGGQRRRCGGCSAHDGQTTIPATARRIPWRSPVGIGEERLPDAILTAVIRELEKFLDVFCKDHRMPLHRPGCSGQ